MTAPAWLVIAATATATATVACGGSPATPPQAPPPAQAALSNTVVEAQEPHALLASLERTACFGSCPIYKISVFRDGAIEWEGTQYVKILGKAVGRATPAQLQQLRAAFAKAGYSMMRASYEQAMVTDQPTMVVAFADGPSVKTVKHYGGDSNAPPSLYELETSIDTILNTEQWIGSADLRRRRRRRYP
jgi:hypothetical protein|nr:DUF6438 domain-containing protein [Kofleriaceae bacterium]